MIKNIFIFSIIFVNFLFCFKSIACTIDLSGKCADFKNGVIEECDLSKTKGICVDFDGKCKCIQKPNSCLELEIIYPNVGCFDIDGDGENCPQGKLISIDYGILYGQFSCCCNTKKTNNTNFKVEKNETTINSENEILALP